MNDGTDVDKLPILDIRFDSDTLSALRADVQTHASRVGFPDHRVEDMVLAIHELAANAVHHGAGAGRLRIWDLAGALHCQVDDGPLAFGDPAAPGADHGASDHGASDHEDSVHEDSKVGQGVMSSWQAIPGHGLWVVQQVANQLQVTSGTRGTRATATFNPSPESRLCRRPVISRSSIRQASR
jgi:two-component sensor histidine kinase